MITSARKDHSISGPSTEREQPKPLFDQASKLEKHNARLKEQVRALKKQLRDQEKYIYSFRRLDSDALDMKELYEAKTKEASKEAQAQRDKSLDLQRTL
jgi:hypothetical protein